MNKTAIEVALHRKPANKQSSNDARSSELSNTAHSSSSRFPPIENALLAIIHNKRLEEALKDG